jgi:hypothetical protein
MGEIVAFMAQATLFIYRFSIGQFGNVEGGDFRRTRMADSERMVVNRRLSVHWSRGTISRSRSSITAAC